MIITAFILTVAFALFSFSLVSASREFQKLKPQIECFLNSDNEKIRLATEKILKDSLSFFSSYRVVFKILTSSVDKNTKFSKKEENAAKKLIEFFFIVNGKAYWYNYLIIMLFLSIFLLFLIMRNRISEIINFSLIDIERQYFTKPPINSPQAQH
ncbi:hypothetical protein UPTC15622_00917 [Campylobacter lari]|uniref:hypothetical protein n=1 Tax=Campylobacter TaxID=194 RepID=UPI00215221EC|nr:hypothetical protein [Campylobacter lari]MCR6566519.1 hypothetical protein [Campylobacter lari]